MYYYNSAAGLSTHSSVLFSVYVVAFFAVVFGIGALATVAAAAASNRCI